MRCQGPKSGKAGGRGKLEEVQYRPGKARRKKKERRAKKRADA